MREFIEFFDEIHHDIVSLRADEVEVPVTDDGFPVRKHTAPSTGPIPGLKDTVGHLIYRHAVVATVYAKTTVVYAGHSALLLQDAYVKINKTATGPGICFTDDLRFITTRMEPSGQVCHENIIFQENALALGIIRHIKATIHGSLSKEEMRILIERWQREGRNTLNGRCPSPTAKVLHSAEYLPTSMVIIYPFFLLSPYAKASNLSI
ncbi:hypothetical protein ACHAQI_004231 [Fusarium lateritium]